MVQRAETGRGGPVFFRYADLLVPTCLAIACIGGAQDAVAANEKIEIVSGFDEARELAALEKRPLLVLLGADWCGWCRKLEADLESEEAVPILKQWVIAKVDVDAEPDVAEKLAASSLPAIRVLDAAGEVVAARTGYLATNELQAWLDEHIEAADPELVGVLSDKTVVTEDDVRRLITILSRRSPAMREAASRRLIAHQSLAARPLLELLRNGDLGAQLAVLEILETWKAPTAGLDPWRPETIKLDTIAKLMDWAE